MLLDKVAVCVLVSLSVVACEGGDGNGTTGQSTSAPATVAEALKMADQRGTYPPLNRDTSIAGPDANNNGVRDDIDAYIASLPDSAAQKAALAQESAALTHAMSIDTTDPNALADALKRIANAATCVQTRYYLSTAKSPDMEKLTINTKVRFMAYEAFNTAASGHSFVLPQGDGCVN